MNAHNALIPSNCETTSSTNVIPQAAALLNGNSSNPTNEDDKFLEKQLALFETQETDKGNHTILQNKTEIRNFILQLEKEGLILRTKPNLSPTTKTFKSTIFGPESTVYFTKEDQPSSSGCIHDFVKKVVKRISFPLTNRLKTLREIKITTELNHPNIIRPEGYFFDAGTDTEQPYCYIVMPYIKYDFLGWLAKEEYSRFGLPTKFERKCKRTLEEVRRVLTDIVKVLHYLHAKTKYIHMDIKFDNILITEEGKVILIDFGLAKDTSNLTSQAGFTHNFAAPEVIKYNTFDTKDITQLTNKIDVYSFGAMLYYLFVDCKSEGFKRELINFDQIMQRIEQIFSKAEFKGNIVDMISDLIISIGKCLSDSPNSRPTAGLLRHFSFFSDPVTQSEENQLSSEEKEMLHNLMFAKALNFIIDQNEFDKGFKILNDLAHNDHQPSTFYIMLFTILKDEFPKIDIIKPKSLETAKMLTSWKETYFYSLKANDSALFDISAKSKEFFEKNADLGDKHSLFALGFINYFGDKELSRPVSLLGEAKLKKHELAEEFLNQILTDKERKPDGFLEQSKFFVPRSGDTETSANIKLYCKKTLQMLHENGKLCGKPKMAIMRKPPKRGIADIIVAEIDANEWNPNQKKIYMISNIKLSTEKPQFLEKCSDLSQENILGIEKMFFDEEKDGICVSVIQPFVENGFFDWLFQRQPDDWIAREPEWETIEKKNRCTFEEIRSFLIQALRAIQHLHCFQLVHRNICFHSFRITEASHCYLVGLDSIRDANNSGQGDFLLEPEFPAPEFNDLSFPIDINSDIYSFGVMLYILFVGPTQPQPGEKVCKEYVTERINRVFQRNLKKPEPISAEVIEDLCEIMNGCLEEDPDDRPCSMKLLNSHEFFSRNSKPKKKKKLEFH